MSTIIGITVLPARLTRVAPAGTRTSAAAPACGDLRAVDHQRAVLDHAPVADDQPRAFVRRDRLRGRRDRESGKHAGEYDCRYPTHPNHGNLHWVMTLVRDTFAGIFTLTSIDCSDPEPGEPRGWIVLRAPSREEVFMSQRYGVTSEVRDQIEVFSLKDGARAVAEIAPALGNNCYSFSAGTAVLEPVDFAEFRQRPTSYGIPILFPFPNRVRDGRFRFGGEEYAPDPPRHGFVRDKAWVVEQYGASEEEGAWIISSFDTAAYGERILKSFPFPFRLEVTYRLKNGALEMATIARNTGTREMPVGFGIHPYFRLPANGVVTVPASERWELSDSLPTGNVLAVAGKYATCAVDARSKASSSTTS